MAEIVVHKLYEEKERQYIIDAYENFGKKTARKWKEELKKIQNFLKKYPEGKPPFLGAPSLAICFGVLILCVISSWFIIMMNPWMWCILLTFGI